MDVNGLRCLSPSYACFKTLAFQCSLAILLFLFMVALYEIVSVNFGASADVVELKYNVQPEYMNITWNLILSVLGLPGLRCLDPLINADPLVNVKDFLFLALQLTTGGWQFSVESGSITYCFIDKLVTGFCVSSLFWVESSFIIFQSDLCRKASWLPAIINYIAITLHIHYITITFYIWYYINGSILIKQ